MQDFLRPAAEWELSRILLEAAQSGTPVEIVGGGTKRAVGRPMQTGVGITTSGLRAITLYEPNELVMSAESGVPLAEVEKLLAAKNQMLAFEPIDLGPVLGQPARAGSIGAVFVTNLSGSRRILAGAARDHLLGLRGITGRAEGFKSGGRVMKNVTGYDVARGLTGSWGTLAVATEVTFKVLPRPEETATLVLFDLTDEIAIEVLCAALGTPYEVSGTVHLQAPFAKRLRNTFLRSLGKSVTMMRLETFRRFMGPRIDKLKAVLKFYGDVHVIPNDASLALWSELNELSVLQGSPSPLWRISVPPRQAPSIVASIARHMPVIAFYDWSGGLVWLEVQGAADAGATDVRRVIARASGHATLIRAEAPVRAGVDVFQPLDAGVERITRGLKATFDPVGILNPGRMYANI